MEISLTAAACQKVSVCRKSATLSLLLTTEPFSIASGAANASPLAWKIYKFIDDVKNVDKTIQRL